MSCSDAASGTRVSITYTEEPTCGVPPPALATATTNIAADKTGSAAGEMEFTRAAGSFITDGIMPYQWVTVAGFAAAGNNRNWRVKSVAALLVTVYDDDDDGVDEAAEVGQTMQVSMALLRATTRQLDLTKDVLESEEVRATRQISDVRHGFNQVEGSPGYELSNGAYSDFIRCALSSEWVTPVYTGDDLGITAAAPGAGFATLDRETGNWADDGFRPGDVIQITGSAQAANNAYWQVVSITDEDMVIADPASVVVTVAAATGPEVVYPGARMDIGLSLRTMTVEQRFDDIAQYRAYHGLAVNGMNWTISPESIVGGTFDLIGMSGGAMSGSSLIGARLPIPAPTNTPFAAFDGTVYEGGVQVAVVTSLEFGVQNNRRLEAVVGSKFSPGVFEGRCTIEGTMTAFLQGNTIYNKFYNETDSSLWVRLQDPQSAGQFMSIVFPRVKYTSSDMDPPQEGPVPLNMGFRALEAQVRDIDGELIATSMTIQTTNVR